MRRGGERRVLIVEDDAEVQRQFKNVFARLWVVECVETVASALAAVGRAELACAVVDARLPDGSGADVIRALRARQPCVPILATTGYPDERAFIAIAQEFGAEFSLKPSVAVIHFARRQAIREHLPDEGFIRRLDAFAQDHDLSLRQTEMVALASLELTYDAIAERLGVTANTIRTQVQRISAVCGGMTLGEIAHHLRCEHAGMAGREFLFCLGCGLAGSRRA